MNIKSIFNRLFISFSFIIFIMLINIEIQANEKDIQISLNYGAGFGANQKMESNFSLLGIVNANVSIDNLLFSVRNVKFVEVTLFGNNPKEYARDIAIMIGQRNRNENNIIDISAGVGFVSGLQRGEF